MALTGEEIRANLARFAARWSLYDRSERSGAQLFLNELFACYGRDLREVAELEAPQEGRFLDLIWPQVCIFEMKAPKEAGRLAHHREQALAYWRAAADDERGIPAPRYVVLCAFQRFEVWQPGEFPRKPRTVFDIVELPDRYDALLFLAGDEPVFKGGQEAVTREAVGMVVELARRLDDRRAAGPDELSDFVLQCVWCMFAEDLAQIPGHRFTRLLEGRRSLTPGGSGSRTSAAPPRPGRPATI